MGRLAFKNASAVAPLSSLEILKEKPHAITGGKLVVARISADMPDLEGRFVTTWVPAWRVNIPVSDSLKTRRAAVDKFNRLKDAQPPVTGDMVRDWQKERAYKWEYGMKWTAQLDEKAIGRTVEKLSERFGVPAPTHQYVPGEESGEKGAYYAYSDSRGRFVKNPQITIHVPRLEHVMHEVAHHIDVQVNRNYWGWHGPSFVRTMIMIHKNFMDEDDLEEDAEEARLVVAREDALPIARLSL